MKTPNPTCSVITRPSVSGGLKRLIFPRKTAVRLALAGWFTLLALPAAQAATTYNWSGASGTDIGTAASWGGTLPSVSAGDTAQWNGTVSGSLSLTDTTTSFAGASGNPGINLSLTAAQTGSLSIDSGVNTSALRMNGLTIASGAGGFTLGDGLNTFNLTLGGAAGTHTWVNNSANTATINSDVVWGLGGGGAHTLAVGGSGNWTFNNVMGQGSGTLSVSKTGTGTMTMTGVNTYTGSTAVSGGTLSLTGSGKIASTAAGFLIGTVSGTPAAVYQSAAGTLTTAQATGGGWQLGSVPGAFGYYNLSAGTMTIQNNGEFDPAGSGGGAGTFGQFDMSGGTVNVGVSGTGASYFLPCRGAAGESSVVNFGGGTLTVLNGMADGQYGGYEANWAAGGQTNVTTISGSALFQSLTESVKLNWANNAGNVGVLNLNGGTWQMRGLNNSYNLNVRLNFNGGTVKAGGAANTTFLGNSAAAYVYAGGGTIDNNSQAITITQPVQASTGNGIVTIPVSTGGAGYIMPPLVLISDTTGNYATAYAQVSGGSVSSIVVTCPGTNYSSTPTITLVGGGYTTAATLGTVTTAANTSGSLTFQGSATTTLTGAGTFNGAVKIGAGTVYVNPGNAANNRTFSFVSSITVSNGATLQAGPNGLFGWDGTQEKPITVNAGGTLTANGTLTSDVGVGTVTLAGGTLATLATAATDYGSFRFDNAGDKLVVTADSTVSAANVKFANGGAIDVAAGKTLNFTGTIIDPSLGGASSVVKSGGTGTLTFAGVNPYTGSTTISNGTIKLTGSGAITGSTNIFVASGATFDVSAVSYSMSANQAISGNGVVTGAVTTASSTSALEPAGTGTAGTLSFSNNLTMTSGGAAYFDVSTSAASGNDQIVVAGNLALGSADTIHINALGAAANLDQTADYVLFSVAGTTTLSSTPVLTWDGTTPANYLSYSIQQVGQNVVLHYVAATAPTLTATSAPATAVRNQAVTITATVTPGSSGGNPVTVTNVQVNATAIGGPANAPLVLSGVANVYTNTFLVAATVAPGAVTLPVVATDVTPLSSPAYYVTNVIVATNEVWTGAGSDNNWSTSPNWNTAAPAMAGDSVTFAGTTQLSPNLDVSASVTGLTFDSTAGNFNLATANSSVLTLAGGVTNNSANAQVLNTPVVLSGAQTFNAAAGNLTLASAITNAGNTVTVLGAANTVVSGTVNGSGAFTMNGAGTLTVSGNLLSTGTVNFNNGTGVVSGVVSPGAAEIWVSDTSGNGTLNVAAGGTLTASNWLVLGRTGTTGTMNVNGGAVFHAGAGNISLGTLGTAPSGTMNLNSGSISNLAGETYLGEGSSSKDLGYYNQAGGTASLGNFYVGHGTAAGMGIGSATVSGGTLTAANLEIGYGNNNTQTGTNVLTIAAGATVNATNFVRLGFAGSATLWGILTNNGGNLNVGASLYLGYWDPCVSVLTLNAGNINLNNNGSIIFAFNSNHTGNGSFLQNGGNVTFYSDAGTTVGGTGALNLCNAGSSANTYTLAGGTLTVPRIQKVGGTGTATFNFNGGTLKAAGNSTSFITNLTAVNVQAGGATIDSGGYNVTVGQALLNGGGNGGLTKAGLGLLTLTNANTYTGNTTISAGTLALSVAGALAASPNIVVSNGATFDVSASTFSLAAGQTLKGSGTINGNLATAATTASLQPGSNVGALTFNNNLNLSAGSSDIFELSTTAGSGNDQVVVGGNLTLNSATTIHLSVLSGAANLDTADYVLFAVAGTTTMASLPALVWDGTAPANYLNYSIQLSGNNVVLHYSAALAPTVAASASPATGLRNQSTTITATVTPGSGNIVSVTANLSAIGGSATASLVLSATPNVYTNTFAVSAGTTTGVKSLTVTVTDDTAPTALTGTYTITPFTVTDQGPVVWNGAGTDDNWSTNPNWASGYAPALTGDAVTFAGTTRTTPNLDNSYSLPGLTFDSTAGSFDLGTANGSSLTLTGGVTNNSANAQTVNVPVTLSGAQVVNAAAGALTFSQNITNGGSTVTVTGPSNTLISAVLSGGGGLTKTGNGVLTLTGNNTFTGNVFGNAGTIVMDTGAAVNNGGNYSSIGQAGTDNATLTLKGTATFTNNADFNVGDIGSSTGTLNIQDSAVLSVGQLFIASANAAGSTATGTINQTGGSIIENNAGIGFFVIGGRNAASTLGVGVYNMSGGTLTAAAGIRVGSYGTGTMTITNTAVVNANGGLNIARLTNSIGTLNLDGGTVTTLNITSSTGVNCTNNFNGATVKPTSANTWISGLAQCNVRNGGAILDTAGINVTVSQALQHSVIAGDNATDGGLAKNGAGTLTLTGTNTYTGNTTINAGTLALSGSGSLAAGSSLSLAAGATLDVSALTGTTYTLGSGAALSAAGTGASPSAIKGNTLVDLGSRPVTLTYDGTNPALTVTQGALALGGNPFTVNGSALASGTYTLATVTSGSITDGGSYPGVAGTAIDGTHYGAISVSGGNVILTVALQPVVTGKTYWRAPGTAVKIYATDLAATATVDASLAFTATFDHADSSTTNSVILETNGLSGNAAILMYPGSAANTADAFGYTINDGHGGTASGTVTILIASNVTGQASINLAGQSASISYFGIPGYHYVVQRSVDSLTDWMDLTNVTVLPSGTAVTNGVITAPVGGGFTATDALPPVSPTSVFYRLRSAP